MRDAKLGREWADIGEARIAMGWAWAILGAPDARTSYGPVIQVLQVLTALLAGSGGNMATGDIFSGRATHDDNPVVIRTARRVEQANRRVADDLPSDNLN